MVGLFLSAGWFYGVSGVVNVVFEWFARLGICSRGENCFPIFAPEGLSAVVDYLG